MKLPGRDRRKPAPPDPLKLARWSYREYAKVAADHWSLENADKLVDRLRAEHAQRKLRVRS